jgi:hypothetical protein
VGDKGKGGGFIISHSLIPASSHILSFCHHLSHPLILRSSGVDYGGHVAGKGVD